jgi:predicted O-linked N-acetylglucosamine transferase (SPINDLY family)
MRARLLAAFDQFHDVRAVSDHDVAKLLHDLQVDIAVDLSGHTHDSRPGIFAHRPAPVQVSYLGFPATTGASFIDYIIADRFVIPPERQRHYSEKVVYLPDTFQANDSKRPVPSDVPSRAAVGLPDDAFVFCCFNNSYKVTPAIFEIWMRLLREVKGSVLWMFASDASVERNLRREADERAIASHRIILAPRVPYPDYLAQYHLADLFLDTIPFNGGTTVSDALWCGLPIVTCSGEAFAARMAGSLLNAAGLPEMVTANLVDYEALALKLARDPALLAAVRAKLVRNRDTCPLFNSKRFTRHIEAAYTTMWKIWQRGEAPKNFIVDESITAGHGMCV